MKVNYGVTVTKTFTEVGADELPTLLESISYDSYAINDVNVERHMLYDCDGYPTPSGLYNVIVKNGVGGCSDIDSIISFAKIGFECLKGKERA